MIGNIGRSPGMISSATKEPVKALHQQQNPLVQLSRLEQSLKNATPQLLVEQFTTTPPPTLLNGRYNEK